MGLGRHVQAMSYGFVRFQRRPSFGKTDSQTESQNFSKVFPLFNSLFEEGVPLRLTIKKARQLILLLRRLFRKATGCLDQIKDPTIHHDPFS